MQMNDGRVRFYGGVPSIPFRARILVRWHKLFGHTVQRSTTSNRLFFPEDGPADTQVDFSEPERTDICLWCINCRKVLWESGD